MKCETCGGTGYNIRDALTQRMFEMGYIFRSTTVCPSCGGERAQLEEDYSDDS